MDFTLLKSLLPLGIAVVGAVIALAKLQAKSAENSKQLDMLIKDVARLEKEAAGWSDMTVRLVAKMEQAEKSITGLWDAHDKMIGKLERHRDRLDERFMALREKINGGHK